MNDAADGQVFEFAGFVLDPRRRRLTAPTGETVVLKPRVFDVLAALVARPGEIQSKQALLDAVWPDTIVEENNLNQAISSLRRALDDSRDEPRFIATIPGRGYQFVAPVTMRAASPDDSALVRDEPPSEPVGLTAGPATTSPAAPDRRRDLAIAGVALLGVAMLAIAVLIGTQLGPESEDDGPVFAAAASEAGSSIAVLPFADMSAERDQGYFADGVAEEILNQLSRVEDLRVIARTSSFVFRDEEADVREIGETLAVTHLLQGSVRKADDRIRVSAQLVSASDGVQVWSESYDRQVEDMFAIQDEIALAVAEALSVRLGTAAADYGGTDSFEAYDRLLRGLSLHAQVTPDALRQAAEQYRLALEIDPLYARAWAERAISLSALITTNLPDAAALLSARDEASARALELAPDMPLALATKMWVHADRREWIPADEACAAVFAAPPDPRAQWVCAGFLSVTGRVSRALPYRVAGRDADPLSMNTSQALSRQYAYLGRFEDFEREYERARELPGARWALEAIRFVHLVRRSDPRMLAAQVDVACALPDAPRHCAVLVQALRSPENAEPLLRELLETQLAGGPGVGEIAAWAAALGQPELSLDALEAFAPTAASSTLQTLWFEALADVRAHPRFKAIVRDIGYLDLWRSSGQWPDYCRPLGQEDFECF